MIREQTVLLKITYDDEYREDAPDSWDWNEMLGMGFHSGDSENVEVIEVKDKMLQAVPDLIAACQSALDYFNETRSGREYRDNGGNEPDLLRAAIAKAVK